MGPTRRGSGMNLTTKQVVAIIGSICTIVSFARVSVLFLEALAAVRDERNQDVELLELCAQGSARSSQKMRTACLHAQSDKASPILLKAVLRAVSIAFEDFSESVSSPGKMLIVVLFVISSIFLPINAWLRAILVNDNAVDGAQHVVVVAHDTGLQGHRALGLRGRFAKALRLRKQRNLALTHKGGEDEEFGDAVDHLVDVDLSHGHAKWD